MTEKDPNGAAEVAPEHENVSILDSFDMPEPPSHPGEVDAAAETPVEESEDEADDADPSAEADEGPEADADKAESDEPAEAGDDDEAADVAEPETKPKQYVEADALTRLRDGTEITIGELKKRADGEAIREREAQISAEQQRVSQQSEQYQRALDQALGFIEARLPPMPDSNLLNDDPIGYITQKEAHERAVQELQWFQYQKQQHDAYLHEQQQKAAQEQYEAEIARAKEVIPDLADPAKARPIVEKLQRAHEYFPNMPREAVSRLSTAWEMEILRDAIAYREMQAQKAKVVEKVKDVPPVQPAGRRVSPTERQSRALKDDLATLKKTGDRKVAESILSRFA